MLMLNLSTSIDIWERLIDAGLVFLLMGIGIVWLVKYLKVKDKIIKAKDEQLSNLNEYVRENDRNNLEVLSEVNNTLDKIIVTQKVLNERAMESQKNNTESVLKEILALKESIEIRMENLSDKMRPKR